MNILLIHEAEYIEKVIYEYQIIPELLSSKGHNVYVLDYPTAWKKKSFFDFGSLKSKELFNVKRANKSKGITLIRPGFLKIPVLSRISAFISYFFVIPKIIKKYRIEKIILYSAPTNGLQTIFWAKKFKIPVLFRLLDVLHQLVPYKILSVPTYFIEKIIYKNVDEILAITPKLTEYAINMGGNPKTTSYLPSGADRDLFYPQNKNANLLKQYSFAKKDAVILFAGTLYRFSGLDHLLNYYGKHKKELPFIKFLIVGGGEQFKNLKKIIQTHKIEDNVILTGFVNYPDLPKYLNLADICINPFEINKVTNIIFPGKIYQYLACEKPVIATRLEGLINLFPDNNGKDNIYYFDIARPEEFFRLINKIKKTKIEDSNPSLKEITNKIKMELLNLNN